MGWGVSHSQTRREAVGDLICCGLVLAGSFILFIGASTLPPPRFEPLGSAAMPRILGILLILLAAIVSLQAIAGLRRTKPTTVESDAPSSTPYRGLIVLVALLLYVFSLDILQLPFLIATPLFVTVAGTAMHRMSVRSIVLHGALGLCIAILISTVFSQFLGIEIG
jgi:putative tricarboxylic transport membrane protein